MNVFLIRTKKLIIKLSKYPQIGKVISSFFGLLEVPLLELIYFIDKRIKPGSYQHLMKSFSYFYGSKVIPLKTKIEGMPTLAPTEEILEIIKRVPAVSIGYCYCRVKYQNCDNPVWTCIHIGTAKHLEELAKKIPLKSTSYEEVEKLLYKANELGLVHQLLTAPSPEFVYVICSCCPCCCVMLRNAIDYQIHGAVLPSNFIAKLNEDNCNNCGVCLDRCHFNALKSVNNEVKLDTSLCAGCGLCVNTCPTSALQLIRRKMT